MMFVTLCADRAGHLIDYPGISMLGRSGNQWVEPEKTEMIPIPKGASLVSLPGHFPVGLNAAGEISLIKNAAGHKHNEVCAVAALLPQGFTRTLLPASVSQGNNNLPVYGYAAIGLYNDMIYVAAVKSDNHVKWHPKNYNTSQLEKKINRMLKKNSNNRILKHLANCALGYGCYTAQNIFYQRWEGGIPSMAACNADCIACISESHGSYEAPQNRLNFNPEVEEIAQVAIEHLNKAPDAIISFGQGCEGEPALNAVKLSRAIQIIRQKTSRGTINMNTNAGYTKGVKLISDAGLDSIRVTIFSCRETNYNRYHRPIDYKLSDVKNSINYAYQKGLQVSLNLLVFPGFSDREQELEALIKFIKENPVHMIQLRNLNIDPELLMNQMEGEDEGIGIVNFINILKKEVPQVVLGSYSRPFKRMRSVNATEGDL